MKNIVTVITLAGIISFFSCDKNNTSPAEKVTVIKAAGNIQDDVDAFKSMLGPLNTTPGAVGGHREINWDAVPDSLLNQPLPENFFNQTDDDASAALQK